MMKVVHVMECFAGGTFEFLVRLTNYLTAYEHVVIYGKRENTPKDFSGKFLPNTTFIPWQSVGREINITSDTKALIQLRSLLKAIPDKDAIHLHSSKAGFLGRIAALSIGQADKVIYTAHGVSFLRTDVSKRKKQMYILLEKMANWCGGQIVACSASEKEEFLKNHIKNVIVINNGIEIKRYKSEIIKKEANEIIIATVGRLSTQKNPNMFNQIAGTFANNKNVRFLWIGDGELKHEITNANVEVTGWMSQKEVMEKLSIVDIYLSTSSWEGLPLSVLEAMALQKPLILSDCVGNRDLVKKEINGYLFRDKEMAISMLHQVLQDTDQRNKMGRMSLEILKNSFSLDEMIKKYNQLYENVKNK